MTVGEVRRFEYPDFQRLAAHRIPGRRHLGKVRELKQQDENECNVVKFNRRYATTIIYLTFRGQTSTAKFGRPLRGQNGFYYFFPKSTARL